MKNHATITSSVNAPLEAISVDESKRFIQLEQTVHVGRKAFVEVGLALAEIRDRRLYRADYHSFEDYCREKWKFTRQYVNQIIVSAGVVKSLPPLVETLVSNQKQAHELAKVEPEKRAGVLERATSKGKLTAKAIREAVVVRAPEPAADTESKNQEIHLEEIKSLWQLMDAEHRKQFLKWKDSEPAASPSWRCDSCGEEFDTDDEAVKLYECGECGEVFSRENSANGDGTQCPGCNKFGRTFSDHGCPECSEGQLERLEEGTP